MKTNIEIKLIKTLKVSVLASALSIGTLSTASDANLYVLFSVALVASVISIATMLFCALKIDWARWEIDHEEQYLKIE